MTFDPKAWKDASKYIDQKNLKKVGTMKVVCMCQGGNSRSVGCAFLLKYTYGMDALAVGWEKNSKETLKMLFEWANAIVIMQAEFEKYVPEEYRNKVFVVDVGPDVWCNSLHPGLLQKCSELLEPIVKPVYTTQDGLQVPAEALGLK